MGKHKRVVDMTPEEHEDVKRKKRERYKEKRDYILLKAKEYRETHKEELQERRARYREQNREKLREKQRVYRKNHLEKCRERDRQYVSPRFLKYKNWAHKLTPDEDPIQDEKGYILVRDFHTKKYFYPLQAQLRARVYALNHEGYGECHLYASDESKHACPIFGATRDPAKIKGKRKSSTPVDRFWRNQVISRADGHCERCGKESDKLIAHHVAPRATCAFDGDIDNGMALCPECHKEVHHIDGCRFHELATEKRETA